jgi:hypothetical protein
MLGVPCAEAAIDSAGVVLIGDSAAGKRAEDGNVYSISWLAMTNSNSDATNDPVVIAANADLATNLWPRYRMHLELSIDGGQTWARRIGYGLQTPKGATGGEWGWSPPDDAALLTTNAILRLVDLDGRVFTGPTNGAPYDVGTNGIRSGMFAIVGAVIEAPAGGTILYPDTPLTVDWRHCSDNTTFDIHWLTPSTNAWLTTVSNCVIGLNSVTVQLPADLPVVPAMRICVMGVEYPAIVDYSDDLEVQP